MHISCRWVVMLLFCTPAWALNDVVVYSISFVEHSLLKTMDWSNADYSAVVSTTFAGAMLGPLLILWLQRLLKLSHLTVLFGMQCLNVVSMAAFSFAVFSKAPLWCVALSRLGLGACVGVVDAWILHTVARLFPTDAAAPFGVQVTGCELALFSGRVLFPKAMRAFGSVVAPFALCTAICLFPIICIAFGYVFLESAVALVNRSAENCQATDYSEEEFATVESEEVSTVTQMWRLPFVVKCVIVFTSLWGTTVDMMSTLMTEPLVATYDMSETQADNWLALASLSCVAFCALSGWLMDSWQLHFHLGAVAATTWLVAFTLLAFGTRQRDAAVAIVLYGVGYPISNVAMTVTAFVVPSQHLALASALQSTVWWSLSILCAEVFGFMADATGGFRGPILFIAVFLATPHFVLLFYLWNHTLQREDYSQLE